MSANQIERKIDELEDFVESCKFKPLSKDIILVDKTQLIELIADLRDVIPDEVERYQKVLAQKDEIFADAKARAAELIKRATDQMNQRVDDDEITRQAYAQANQIVQAANEQAQDITAAAQQQAQQTVDSAGEQAAAMMDNARQQADAMLEQANAQARSIVDGASAQVSDYNERAQSYLEEMLLHLEQLTSNVITDTNNAYSTCLNNMNSYLQTVRNDRNTLVMQRQRAQQQAALTGACYENHQRIFRLHQIQEKAAAYGFRGAPSSCCSPLFDSAPLFRNEQKYFLDYGGASCASRGEIHCKYSYVFQGALLHGRSAPRSDKDCTARARCV